MPDWSYQTILRPVLFRLPAVRARDFALAAMGRLARTPLGPQLIDLLGHMRAPTNLRTSAFGMEFPSPIGLGGGLDIHATALPALARFGFGFLEVGPVTLEPFPGEETTERRLDDLAIHYADAPINDGADVLFGRLASLPRLHQPMGVRLAHKPGISATDAARERCQLIQKLPDCINLVTLDTRWSVGIWTSPEWEAHLAMVVESLRTARASLPLLLAIPPDLSHAEVARLLATALEHGIVGVVVCGGVGPNPGGRLTGAPSRAQSREMVQYLHDGWGSQISIIGSGGVHEPGDALALLDAGATLVQIHSGLVYTGPGLPKRINEAIVHRRQSSSPIEQPFDGLSILRRGWFWTFILGAGMILGGILGSIIAVTRVVLPYDEAFAGMTRHGISLVNERLLPFMAHDRVTLSGTMISIGVLYSQLAVHAVRRGAHWAWLTVAVSAVVGFASFFLCLGFGYFDPLHALVSALLFPFFVAGLVKRPAVWKTVTHAPDLHNDRDWRLAQWGQLIFIVIGFGLTLAGITIATIGVTHVFVPQDLMFLRTSSEAISSANPHLVPLIAHDRAGFGGALASDGLAVLLASLWGFRRQARWLWRTLLWAGLPGFLAGFGVHLAIGYMDMCHLAPAFVALLLYITGLLLSYPYLCKREGASELDR